MRKRKIMAIAVMSVAAILGMHLFPAKAKAAPDPPKMLFYTVDEKTCNVTVKYEGLGDATMYILERKDDKGQFLSVDYREVFSSEITGVLTDKGNYPGMKNIYRLTAWKVNGGESHSDTFTVKTPLSTPICDKRACKAWAGRVKLVWNRVSMAKYYKVSRSSKKNGKYRVVKKTDSLYFYDEGLKANTVYNYKITAVSSAGVESKAVGLKKKTAGKEKSFSAKAVECYKKKPDSKGVKYNAKTMRWCTHCTHTGKEKCMSCSGTGKKKTMVYNKSKRIYEYIYGTCPFCRNGYTTCISCQGRGWNWK